MIRYEHPPRGNAGFSLQLSIFWIFFRRIMKKLSKILLIILVVIILLGLGYFGYIKYEEYKEAERIRNAIIRISFIDPLEVDFQSEVKLSDLITDINGTLCDDFTIDTSKIESREIKFEYINEEEIKIPYKFNLIIKDKTPPVIWLNDRYSVTVGTKKTLEELIMCGDNLDDTPVCTIEGSYDLNKIGEYPLIMKATDNSGNETIKEFILDVKKSSAASNKPSIPFSELYSIYKKENTKIGIDVSKWQGNIDYQKVKDAGVEFVYIKIGGQNGIGKDYYIDPKFERNYEGFKNVGIPIGLYFYTYADNEKEAEKQALWIIDELKDRQIDLPIAFDWENWCRFNEFKISFYRLTKTAEKFMDTLKKKGYDGMLYSSKNYLEQIWYKTKYPTWLAHYIDNTTYEGEYKCWQRTNMAKISGITDNTVDFDICYED